MMGKKEVAAAGKLIATGMIGQLDKTRELEKLAAERWGYYGSKCVTSASLGIYAILKYLYPEGKKKIAISSYVCRSVYDAVKMAGCIPVLIDIDKETFGINIKEVLKTGAELAVAAHLFGVRAKNIQVLIDKGIEVIEDCAQRILPSYIKEKKESKWRVYSFEPTKILTGGQGGLICGDKENMKRIHKLLDESYNHGNFCLKLPFTDLQAVIVLEQLKKLDKFLERRKKTASYYIETLIKNNLDNVIHKSMLEKDTWHFRFVVNVNSPDMLIKKMLSRKIICRRPVRKGLHELFKIKGNFKNTEYAMNTLLSLPLYPALSSKEAGKVIREFIRCLDEERTQ